MSNSNNTKNTFFSFNFNPFCSKKAPKDEQNYNEKRQLIRDPTEGLDTATVYQQNKQAVVKKKKNIVNIQKKGQPGAQNTMKLQQQEKTKLKGQLQIVRKQNYHLSQSLKIKQLEIQSLKEKKIKQQNTIYSLNQTIKRYQIQNFFRQSLLVKQLDSQHYLIGQIFKAAKRDRNFLSKKPLKAKLLYRLDAFNKVNPFLYIQQKPCILVIVKTQTQRLVGGFVTTAFKKGISQEDNIKSQAILFSVSLKQVYKKINGKRSIAYIDNLVFGNQDLKIDISKKILSSKLAMKTTFFQDFDCSQFLGTKERQKSTSIVSCQIFTVQFGQNEENQFESLFLSNQEQQHCQLFSPTKPKGETNVPLPKQQMKSQDQYLLRHQQKYYLLHFRKQLEEKDSIIKSKDKQIFQLKYKVEQLISKQKIQNPDEESQEQKPQFLEVNQLNPKLNEQFKKIDKKIQRN